MKTNIKNKKKSIEIKTNYPITIHCDSSTYANKPKFHRNQMDSMVCLCVSEHILFNLLFTMQSFAYHFSQLLFPHCPLSPCEWRWANERCACVRVCVCVYACQQIRNETGFVNTNKILKQMPLPIANSFTKPRIEIRMLIKQTIVSCRTIQVNEWRTKCWQKSLFTIIRYLLQINIMRSNYRRFYWICISQLNLF